MDLVVLEKIESCILNGLVCIVRLEKKSGNNSKGHIISKQDAFLSRGKKIAGSIL